MYLKGVGPARAAMLEAKGLKVVEDLLTYAPFRYEDRSTKLLDILAPEMATVLAEVRSTKVSGFRRRNLGLFEATFTDASRGCWRASGSTAPISPMCWLRGKKVALYGKVEFDTYSGHLAMMHPEYEILADDEDGDASLHTGRIVPVYEAAGKVTTRRLPFAAASVLESLVPLEDHLPEHTRSNLKLPDRWTGHRELHFPAVGSDLRLLNSFRTPAQWRLIFEEFFWLECGLSLKRAKNRLQPGIPFEVERSRTREDQKMLPSGPPARRSGC